MIEDNKNIFVSDDCGLVFTAIDPNDKAPLEIFAMGFGKMEPQDDITPKEAVLLAMIVASIGYRFIDIDGFIKSNKLQRHFV